MKDIRPFEFESFDDTGVRELLPRAKRSGELRPSDTLTPSSARPSMFDVIVVDDDEAALDEMGECLVSSGLSVALAAKPADALTWLRSNEAKVVVTDVRMPGISGLMLAALLREEAHGAPPALIFVSGYADRDTVLNAIRHAPRDFLLKPLDLEALLMSVVRAMKPLTSVGSGSSSESANARVEVEAPPRNVTIDVVPIRLENDYGRQRVDILRLLQRERDIRAQVFHEDIAAGPAWQIIIDLYGLERTQGHNYVTSIALSSHLPLTTALRHIDQLVAEEFIERSRDPSDARRVRLNLTERCRKLVEIYLERIAADPDIALFSGD